MINQEKTENKDWWAPVFGSLITHKDYKKMGKTIWLFLYLLLHADRKTGALFRKAKTITRDIGIPLSTIQKWMSRLTWCGYIECRNTGRGLHIRITKWKSLNKTSESMTQNHQTKPATMTKTGHQEDLVSRKKPLQIKDGFGIPSIGNDIRLKREYIKKNDIDNDKKNISKIDNDNRSFKNEASGQLNLAKHLADKLDDKENFGFYLSISRRYPQDILLKTLREVNEIPSEKIKKSRGALFNHLIKQYGKSSDNHRN